MRRSAVQSVRHVVTAMLLATATISWPCRAAEQPAARESVSDAEHAPRAEFFERHVRPVLIENCVKCHGAEKHKAELRLDSAAGMFQGGESGAVVIPARPEESRLIRRIHASGDEQMPPDKRLQEEDIRALAQWVRDGAVWPGYDQKAEAVNSATVGAHFTEEQKSYWAFQPVKHVVPPEVADTAWPKSPIDRFVLARQVADGLRPAPPAEKRMLLRRVTFDLTGLPPTPDEIAQFEADGTPDAFAKVVDRLLASPAYGERWGQHWLDVVRFAESAGHDGNNAYLHAWRYRDYVIRAFNTDKPFNEFIIEQLAGDLLPKTGDRTKDFDRLVATSFLQIGPKPVVMRDKRQMLLDIADEQIHTTGVAFMALTLGCARCHDHKFDPIPTADYYALAGMFMSTHIMADDAPDSKWLEDTVTDPKGQPATLMMVADFLEAKDMPILRRGNYRTPGDVVPRRFLQIIAGDSQTPIKHGSGRLELARWIASDTHPLTARVMVNRIWQHHFGRGLVATSDNFGRLGEKPTHPELLDWLASKFIASGWSVKALHRELLLSSTYQQACVENAAAQRVDPENHLLWCMPRRRLSAEEVRDGILAVSGELDRTMGGTLFTEGYGPGDESRKLYVIDISTKDPFPPFEFPRRSVYLPVLRNARPEALKLFDTANEHLPTAVRGETTVAPQALFLLNSPFVREQAEALATSALRAAGANSSTIGEHQESLIDQAFRLVLGRSASTAEIARVERFLDAYQVAFAQSKDHAASPHPSSSDSTARYALAIRQSPGLRAYQQFGDAIFNGRDQRFQIDLPSSDDAGADKAIAIELWANLESDAGATIIGADGPGDRLWRIGIDTVPQDGAAANRLFYEYYPPNAGGRRVVVNVAAELEKQRWHHIVATFGNGKRRLFLDGRCVDECDAATVLRPANVPITIGARGDGAEWFHGQVDHVAIYDRPLDESQIARHYRLFGKCQQPTAESPQLLAWRAACQSLLCSNEFIYVE